MAAHSVTRKKPHGRYTGLSYTVLASLFMALSVVIIVAALDYTNFTLQHSIGASAIIFASFGGSGFVLFVASRKETANLARFVKGYALGTIFGIAGHYIAPVLGIYVSVGVVLFLLSIVLVITDNMHAPSVALALGFLLYDVGYAGAVIVALGMVMMVVIRILLGKVESSMYSGSGMQ